MLNISKVPSSVEKELFILVGARNWNEGEVQLTEDDWTKYEHSAGDHYVAGKIKITVDVPKLTHGEAVKQLVAQYEKRKEDINANHYMKIKEVQEKIDSLLTLEYKPQEEEESEDDIPF